MMRSILRRVSVVFVSTSFLASAAWAGCPDPEFTCAIFVPGSELTGYCIGQDCLQKVDGEELSVAPDDDEKYYPSRWSVWTVGRLEPVSGAPFPCGILREGKRKHGIKKYLIEVPPAGHCTVDHLTDNAWYREFIASNPSSDCVGWGECKVFEAPAEAE